MGHYWSEMGYEPERHPRAIDVLDFKETSHYGIYYHKPCSQVFYVLTCSRLPEGIWEHVKTCKNDQ